MGTQKTVTRRLIGAFAFGAIVTALASAGGPSLAAEPYTPKPESAERKAILDALRRPVGQGMKQKVIFIVDRMNVLDRWCFVWAKPRSPKGARLSFRGTRWEKDHRDGFVDDGVAGLLRRDKTGWKVVRWAMGPTDAVWEGWIKPYGLSRRLFR